MAGPLGAPEVVAKTIEISSPEAAVPGTPLPVLDMRYRQYNGCLEVQGTFNWVITLLIS